MNGEGGVRSGALATSVVRTCSRSAARKRMSLMTWGHASASTQICTQRLSAPEWRLLLCSTYAALRHDLSQPSFQIPPLGVVAHQLEGAAVRLGGLGVAAKPPQELCPRGRQQVIPGELAAVIELVYQGETALDSGRHCDRDGAVELDHRGWVHPRE